MLKRRQDTGQIDEGAEAPVRETAGQFLRQKREEFGYDLRDVADRLRIRYVYLAAIEEDRLDDLPGATYAVGFVRAYAELLKLDGPEIVNRFREETAELAKEARLVFPSPESEGKVPSGTILLLSVVVAALVYGGWVFLSSKDRPIAELVPALPERFLALIGQSEPASPESSAPILPVPTASEGAASPSETATTARPEMPPVTAAPVAPVTVETTENPSETVAPPAVAEPPATVTVAAPTITAVAEPETPETPETPEIVTGANTAAESEALPLPSARDRQIPASEPLSDTGGDTPPVTAGNIESMDHSAGDRPLAAAVVTPDTSVSSTPVTAPAPKPEANEVAAPAPVLSDGSPPIAALREDATEAAPDSVDLTALPAPPAPPSIDTTTPREYGEENTDARVVLRAASEVWVQVRDSNGNLLLTRLLRTGDSYRVPNDPGLVMRTGNAGGLDILVDGTTIPRIGSKGAVMKEVQLDADLLKSGTATRQ